MRERGVDLRALLETAASTFFVQVFRDGFFHADMHPGNLFVEPPGTLVPVDFGIMGRLDLQTRRYLAEMLIGFLSGDYRRVAEVHVRAGYVPPDTVVPLFAQACRSIAEPILGRPLAEISFARLLSQLFRVTQVFHMEAQPQLLLLQKTMLQAEGMGRLLDPTINMWTLAQPLVERWAAENLGPAARARDLAADLLTGLSRLPAIFERLDSPAAPVGRPDDARRERRGSRPQPPASPPAWWWLALAAAFLAGLAL